MSEDKIRSERDEISKIISDSFDPQNGDKYDPSDFEWSALQLQLAGYRKFPNETATLEAEIEKLITQASEEIQVLFRPQLEELAARVIDKIKENENHKNCTEVEE